MYKNDLDYTTNLRLLDDITTKQFKQYEVVHKKALSLPDHVNVKRQPDRLGNLYEYLEITINQSLTLQMYPSIFKYLKIKVKDLMKPLNFVYESNNNQCLIKLFLSSVTDSPNILNNNLQVIVKKYLYKNKSRFQYTEPPSHVSKFKCDFVYISIYTDKYADVKLRATAGTLHSVAAKRPQTRQQTPMLSFPRDLLSSREPGSYTYRTNISCNK